MKIALNTAASTWLGGQYYLENLQLALARLDPNERPEVVMDAERIPADADVVFPNWGLGSTGRTAQIHWIPDLQHRALPHNFPRLDRLRRDLGYRRLLRRARLVVVSSQAVAMGVAQAYPRARAKLRILHFRTVVPECTLSSDPGETVARHGIPEAFLLLPNQFWAHKNHATAFAALEHLPLPLVCTGEATDHRRPGYAESLLADVRARGLGHRLHLLGVVPRADYLQLVRAARAVLQPSLFEGWSSIVEDARAFGKPVALSDIPVHREQNPPRGAFFAPRDPQALAAAIVVSIERGSAPEAEAARQQDELVSEYAARFVAIAREAHGTIGR